jgi:hypothetical protein
MNTHHLPDVSHQPLWRVVGSTVHLGIKIVKYDHIYSQINAAAAVFNVFQSHFVS